MCWLQVIAGLAAPAPDLLDRPVRAPAQDLVQVGHSGMVRALVIALKGSRMGVITRVAGTGTLGNSGDDGPATEAELNQPFGVAATADGGFLIADAGSSEVRKVAAD